MKRQTVEAQVTYELIKKENNSVTQETITTLIQKCNTEDKAELILSKRHKGGIVDIKSITFNTINYEMDDDFFFKNAKIINTGEAHEETQSTY